MLRSIPIHPAIKDLVENQYRHAVENHSEYLFNHGPFRKSSPGEFLRYNKYVFHFKKAIQKLELNDQHRPHDCRKQFVTMAKKYNVNDFAIKRIVGHAISDVTEQVYTERSIEWLYDEVKKIKVDAFIPV